MPTQVFFLAYNNDEELTDTVWALDWSEWAVTNESLEERLGQYRSARPGL